MKQIILVALYFITQLAYSQLKPIGTWTDHLPYQSGTSITSDGNTIYCGTKTGIFLYNTTDNSISRWSKVNLLNDVVVDQVKYVETSKAIIVIYENANIDLIKNGRVINIPFIRDNSRITNKTANEIFVKGNLAYISYGFGIVVLDTDANEIRDSYLFGNNGSEIEVNSTVVTDSDILAATDNGIYEAKLNSNLLDFNNWTRSSYLSGRPIKKVFNLNGTNYCVASNQANNRDSVFDIASQNVIALFQNEAFVKLNQYDNGIGYLTKDRFRFFDNNFNIVNDFSVGTNSVFGLEFINNSLFLVNNFHPILKYDEVGNFLGQLKPNGPFERNVFDLDAYNGEVWAVSGGHDFTYNNRFQFVRIYHLKEGNWTSYIEFEQPSLSGLYDVQSVTINRDNPDNIFFGAWGTGLLEWNGNLPFTRYTDENTTLVDRAALTDWVGVGNARFDEDGNVWLTNTYTSNCLSVKRVNGSWKSFNFSQYITSEETAVRNLLITSNGHKWIELPTLNEIIVFDDNGTINNELDDRSVIIKQEAGLGNIPGIRGISMVEDLNGQIWIGTTDGIAVFYNPEDVFSPSSRNAERVLIDDGENVEILLENVRINDIKINGSNQKWIATEQSGVFLISEDGQEVIHNFTEENSPLISNTVIRIAVDDSNGEVYFATSQGVVSYRGASINGAENLSEIKVFPNPVRPDYSGVITISGLMDNTTVKITDINGTLINELISKGGQAEWNGRNFEGREVSTGIYLLFASASNEENNLKTAIGKIMYTR